MTNFRPLGLNESEIITLALAADVDGSQRIDYQEFMKYFKDSLFWVKFNNELQAAYHEECQYTGLNSGGIMSAAAAATPQAM